MRHPRILDQNKSILLIIDVQERFRDHISQFEKLTKNISILARGCEILDVPIIVTEQYPKGLGETVSEIKQSLPENFQFYEKDCFSSFGIPELAKNLEDSNRTQMILCGIETHVCVSQTAHDLLHAGYDVHIVSDAVSSRTQENKEVGLQKIVTAGGVPTSVEASLFEMLVQSGTEKFKQVQKLLK